MSDIPTLEDLIAAAKSAAGGAMFIEKYGVEGAMRPRSQPEPEPAPKREQLGRAPRERPCNCGGTGGS